MAVELMRHATGQCKSSYYTTAVEFFRSVRATYDDGVKKEGDVFNFARHFRLLVIDEVLKRSESPWENNLLFDLISSRYNDQRDTILIDNATPEQFFEAVGPSISSRVNECGGVVHCNWPSFRE